MDQQKSEYLKRYGEPTCYDQAPYGTKCMVNNQRWFMQMSKDEEQPQWVEIQN